MTQAEWRNRPTYSRILTFCEHCKMLREDVRERRNYWPNVSMTGCKNCFDQHVAEVSGVAIC